MVGFQNARATTSWLEINERVGCTEFVRKSPIFFAKLWNFFHILLRPRCTFGAKKSITGTPSKLVLFQKTGWKREKGYSFNHSTERDIVEDGGWPHTSYSFREIAIFVNPVCYVRIQTAAFLMCTGRLYLALIHQMKCKGPNTCACGICHIEKFQISKKDRCRQIWNLPCFIA